MTLTTAGIIQNFKIPQHIHVENWKTVGKNQDNRVLESESQMFQTKHTVFSNETLKCLSKYIFLNAMSTSQY